MLKNKKYLLAVSGGPDSIFLLYKYRNKDVVVAHVNYHQREDSNNDEVIVKRYCTLWKIPFYSLQLSKNDHVKNNFQNWARIKRYEFFKTICKQQKCDLVLTGHHKDDFIETAQMQLDKKTFRFFYGIKKESKAFDSNINRPFLFKYWKRSIEAKVKKLGLDYAIDYSNALNKYTRNAIRLKNKSIWSKTLFYLKIKLLNFWNSFKERKIAKAFEKWQKSNFNQDVFASLKHKNHLIYDFVNSQTQNINLSNGKIQSIKDFILSKKRTNSYKLSKSTFLVKNKGFCFFLVKSL
ncbi:tRNA lysidine(34) synthetase TilS [Mycoplasmopsis gallinacea]|uniref:tRNA(Ile)-lysidine synthase n=1 Tax=Mycoplasmopsis gallinacea TaxID=29556 RepID=A0A449A351_9BACT|nr:tRNA lysidine(34) synthetase TilS [Mycoplasmopsis gallinacea]VEU58700.1 tRNA(Ile)-lysidine synthase [Mycoplasmopsis gallinacea]